MCSTYPQPMLGTGGWDCRLQLVHRPGLCENEVRPREVGSGETAVGIVHQDGERVPGRIIALHQHVAAGGVVGVDRTCGAGIGVLLDPSDSMASKSRPS